MRDGWVIALGVGAFLALAGCGNDSSSGGGTTGAGGAGGAGGTGGAGGGGGTGGAGSECVPACDETEYCAGETCDSPGMCKVRPTICTQVFDPVCGCDGNNYANPCMAETAGTRIASTGTCPCNTNDDCEEDEFCVREGDCRSGLGECEKRETICPLVIDPVCGCDGNDYDNACLASAAGVQVSATGPCN